jgi:flagellin
MRINHNISALKANNQLSRTNNKLDESLEKLSSGYRINSAADDSAGLAISEKMRTQISGLDQASRNASDGISVIQTAEGALAEVESMLQRMRELSVESANGTYTAEDRSAIQSEIDQLSDEITRISETTEFNTMTLLDGNIDRKSYSSDSSVSLVSLSDTVEVGNYKLSITQDARQAVIVGNKTDISELSSENKITKDQAGTININGESITVSEGESLSQVFKNIQDVCSKVDVNVFATDDTVQPTSAEFDLNPDTLGYVSAELDGGTSSLVFVSNEFGSNEEISMFCSNDKLGKLLGLTTVKASAKGFDAEAKVVIDTDYLFQNTATVASDGNKITVSDSKGFQMVFEVESGAVKTVFDDMNIGAPDAAPIEPVDPVAGTSLSITVSVLDAGPMDLQIGANEGQTMSVRIPKVTPKTLGIDKINMGTADGAQEAITLLDNAINEVSAIRSKLGAYQNRLEHSISNLDTTSENMTESLSRIEDVDMAEEMAEYTQKNVLAQAGTSMLAQANQRPQSILSLLQQ